MIPLQSFPSIFRLGQYDWTFRFLILREYLYDLIMTVFCGNFQGRETGLILEVRICASVQQQFARRLPSILSSIVQWGPSVFIDDIDVGAPIKKQLFQLCLFPRVLLPRVLLPRVLLPRVLFRRVFSIWTICGSLK